MVISTTEVGADNDIVIDRHGDISLVSAKYAYANIIRAALLTNYGEIGFFPTLGIPYFDTVFRNRRLIPIWVQSVRDRVKKFSFVEDITNFDYEFTDDGKTIHYELTVKTDDGTVTVSN